MCKHEITFDKLPQAITYLTEQVAELKQLVSELQAPQSEKHLLVGIDDACRIIQKAKPTKGKAHVYSVHGYNSILQV